MAKRQLPFPDVMMCTENTAANWRVFKEAYADFVTATELTGKEEDAQATKLKTVMGRVPANIVTP